MSEIEQTKSILNRIFEEWQFNVCIYDKNSNFLYSTEGSGQSIYRREVTDKIKKQFILSQIPVIVIDEDPVYYMGFVDKREKLYMFGPASLEALTFSQLHSYKYRNKISWKEYRIPYVSMQRALNCLALAYFMITGINVTDQEMIRQNRTLDKIDEKTIFEYQMDRMQWEKGHLEYDEERKWLSSISNGTFDLQRQQDLMQTVGKKERVGVLAQNNNFKQIEYMVISAVCLAARAAIEGGVNATTAYGLSELYYQKIAKCRDSLEILHIYEYAMTDFCEQVRNSRKTRQRSEYIERCKDYIIQHYHQKFSEKELAEELGLNASYLSRKFSESVGMSIKQYLLKKRLEAACNMLKYSNEKISKISDYLCFNSQSHFGKMFQKEYGMTPSEFRNKNRIIDFIS